MIAGWIVACIFRHIRVRVCQYCGITVLRRICLIFLEKIAESRILEAIQDGVFDNLHGKGQPLVLSDDSDIPPELRMAYKILKMADCLPPELELQKQIVTLKELMAGMPDEAAKLQQMRRLQFLIMKLNMMRPASPLLQEHNDYSAKVLEKLDCLPGPRK
jgi:DnaJ homologue, subfamily C, member 28, conserved domain